MLAAASTCIADISLAHFPTAAANHTLSSHRGQLVIHAVNSSVIICGQRAVAIRQAYASVSIAQPLSLGCSMLLFSAPLGRTE